jgi:hypothetical protein
MKKCYIGDEYQSFQVLTGLDFTGSTLGNDFTAMFVDPAGNYYQVPLSSATSYTNDLPTGQVSFKVDFFAAHWHTSLGGTPTSLTPGIVLYQIKKVLSGKVEYSDIFALELNAQGTLVLPTTPPASV